MIVGIDLSTFFIDLVEITDSDDPEPRWTRFSLVGEEAFDRALSVRDYFPDRRDDFWISTESIGIEEPYGKFVVGKLYRVQGAILMQLPRVRTERWMPGEWRKANGLKGNATKEVVALAVREKFERKGIPSAFLDLWPQDAFDAYCVAVAQAKRVEGEEAS